MNSFPANSPEWLSKRILNKGGIISFQEYMDIVLNDPLEGYYGSGKAKLSIDGDFVTSPSLSEDFSRFLAIQLNQWLKQLSKELKFTQKLKIIEFGSGDASLLKGIISYLLKNEKDILNSLSFLIIEINNGMVEKQKNNLNDFINKGVDISWIDFEDLEDESLNGIIIAHEVLDAFPVERIQYSNGEIFRQGVSFDKQKGSLDFKLIQLNDQLIQYLTYIKEEIGVAIPPLDAPDGWTTELRVNDSEWLNGINKKFKNGILLIIDYAIDSKRYYSAKRIDGTLITYKDQKASSDLLRKPADCDITSHLCSDILINQAKLNGFECLGSVKQGEALLALGLSKELFQIQDNFKDDLSGALLKREALLRLVDPLCLGDLKWFVFQKNGSINFSSECIR